MSEEVGVRIVRVIFRPLSAKILTFLAFSTENQALFSALKNLKPLYINTFIINQQALITQTNQ
ncbi:MAG: hypothetical protein F6K40_05345 [Okeania sp. SIO3I5]|uniref:hypothetical protein n=1 Tax=Okeania sp. SIO3I5 TaxID=2607805 RepID=UPI0013BBA699|nr:hypothetical protein [Okeania sp. SIO3I5]NEQ35744.1 hypothetical protein [Okeania sp. SIO3I5]